MVSILETTLVEAVQIRRAQLADLEAITDIYNDAILNTTATFDAEPKSPANRLGLSYGSNKSKERYDQQPCRCGMRSEPQG